MITRSITLALAGILAASCGGTSSDGTTTTTAETTTPPPGDGDPAETPFENPGGMWMPQQLGDHADTLRELGLEIDPSALTDPLAAPLGAIVSLGGCSASFVSPQGLIITNHHCVQGTLQYHASEHEGIVENGFLAATRDEELWNGPSARVWVTQRYTDVTDRVTDGLAAIEDDRARYDAIEKREKEIVAECEEDRPHVRCTVHAFFHGAEFHLIEQLEIRDVRLVYAPHRGVGWFGGDEDNWMWPRHTGDYSFYRAYVAEDGTPADYDEDNVPYRPAHHLKIATTPLRAGDLVMMAGYPGRTFRHQTAAQVEESVSWYYPRAIAMYEEYLALLAELKKKGGQTAVKATVYSFWLGNGYKNNKGMVEGLTKGGLAAEKAALEQRLQAWIAESPEREQAYGGVVAAMDELHAAEKATRERDAALHEMMRRSSLLGAARKIVRLAEERAKPDAEREPGYQERDWDEIRAHMITMQRHYDPAIDRAMFALSLRRAARDLEHNGAWLALVLSKGKGKGKAKAEIDDAALDAAVERLYRRTKLANQEARLALLEAPLAKLKKSRDPMIQVALRLRPLEREIEARDEAHVGAMAMLMPKYIAALKEMADGQLAPDANGTLRVTYGTVRGYRPSPDAAMYEPFTPLADMVAKHTGEDPFDAPDHVLAAAKAGEYGPYRSDELGDVPVDFLADLDITGGNSGSPTLDARGELVGLGFDGNYEAMASDYLFIPELSRSIHVDIRYVLWVMDAADDADHLLVEMGVTPSL